MRKVIYSLLGFNGVMFLTGLSLLAFALVAYHPQVMAQAAEAAPAGASAGTGIGLLAVALATLGSTLASGWALARVGSAALGAVTEKPELFGRSLVYVGLAEGIAIYGVIISIMMLGKL